MQIDESDIGRPCRAAIDIEEQVENSVPAILSHDVNRTWRSADNSGNHDLFVPRHARLQVGVSPALEDDPISSHVRPSRP